MKRPDTKLKPNDIKEYKLQVLPKVKDIEPTYSIVARARNYDIKGGDNIDIDIYLTGSGIPEANKLVLVWSSPEILDASKPGIATTNIIEFRTKVNGEDVIVPLTTEKEQCIELSPDGNIFELPKTFFSPVPKSEERLIPQIMGERISAGYPPFSISLKTLKKAKTGKYKVDIVLTYMHQKVMKQTSNSVEFRITNWWDRKQGWILTAGAVIAFISLILLVFNIWFPIGG